MERLSNFPKLHHHNLTFAVFFLTSQLCSFKSKDLTFLVSLTSQEPPPLILCFVFFCLLLTLLFPSSGIASFLSSHQGWWHLYFLCYIVRWAFQVALVAKKPLANAGDIRDPGYDPWVRKISQRRAWRLTPVFLPAGSHGHRSLVGSTVHWVAKS